MHIQTDGFCAHTDTLTCWSCQELLQPYLSIVSVLWAAHPTLRSSPPLTVQEVWPDSTQSHHFIMDGRSFMWKNLLQILRLTSELCSRYCRWQQLHWRKIKMKNKQKEASLLKFNCAGNIPSLTDNYMEYFSWLKCSTNKKQQSRQTNKQNIFVQLKERNYTALVTCMNSSTLWVLMQKLWG